jgi:hypothetical protein
LPLARDFRRAALRSRLARCVTYRDAGRFSNRPVGVKRFQTIHHYRSRSRARASLRNHDDDNVKTQANSTTAANFPVENWDRGTRVLVLAPPSDPSAIVSEGCVARLNPRAGLGRCQSLMHGSLPHMCGQVARPLLGGGAGGRSPGLSRRDGRISSLASRA